MTALEEIKKAFPNMFRPLKWHHFEGPTEHGCGEWYAHATRGMYHIYDVREKFPNDRPFYAKELSDQFDTLELAQEAIQKRHEGDILLGLEPEFLSTLESLQRENEELRNLADRLKQEAQIHAMEARSANSAVNEIYQIISGSKGELANYHGAEPVRKYVEAAEAEAKRLQAEIDRTERNRDMWKGQVDRQAAQLEDFRSETKRLQVGVYVETLPAVHLISVFADDMNERNWDDKRAYIKQQADRIRTALASTGGEHHAE